LANVYQALEINQEIITVLNKIDLPASDIDKTKKQIEDVIGIGTEDAIPCSGKTGEGVEEILENKETKLLKPFRFNRYAKGELHPTSHSPFPWS